jgi:hypothetical protein
MAPHQLIRWLDGGRPDGRKKSIAQSPDLLDFQMWSADQEVAGLLRDSVVLCRAFG